MKNKAKITAVAVMCVILAAMSFLMGVLFEKQVFYTSNEYLGVTESRKGVMIPPAEIDLSGQFDIFGGFFIYKGKLYMECDRMKDSGNIVGEKLGTATGYIENWKPEDGMVEGAGNIEGDFYAVNGYDSDFIVCRRLPDGELATYICKGGMTVKYGKEIFSDKLHIDEFCELLYESEFSWNYGKNEVYKLNDKSTVENLIKGINKAKFTLTSVISEKNDELFDYNVKYWLYFKDANGVVIRIPLAEGGYVLLPGTTYICAKIPQKTYEKLMEKLDKNIDSTAVGEKDEDWVALEDCMNDETFGKYVPRFIPESFIFGNANINTYIDENGETSTRCISISYADKDSENWYQIWISYKDSSIFSPDIMIDSIENVSKETVSKYFSVWTEGALGVGVWCGDVAVVLDAHGLDAESAVKILKSVKY